MQPSREIAAGGEENGGGEQQLDQSGRQIFLAACTEIHAAEAAKAEEQAKLPVWGYRHAGIEAGE